MRKVIARRMAESWNSVARVTQFDDIDFTRVGELRKKFAPAYEAKGVKLTLTPFVLKRRGRHVEETSDFQLQPR